MDIYICVHVSVHACMCTCTHTHRERERSHPTTSAFLQPKEQLHQYAYQRRGKHSFVSTGVNLVHKRPFPHNTTLNSLRYTHTPQKTKKTPPPQHTHTHTHTNLPPYYIMVEFQHLLHSTTTHLLFQ